MSTMRRRLGTGPNTTSSTEPVNASDRLLPAERIEPAAHPNDGEHRDVVEPRGRRTLGPGTTRP